MLKKVLISAVFGAFFLFSLSAKGQPEPQQSITQDKPAAGTVNLSGAMSAMDSAWDVMDASMKPDEEYTPLDEYYLGRAVAANILKTYRLYTQNPNLNYYLNLICQALVINSRVPEPYNGFHVAILDTAELNAFACPGGYIFVTRGLIEAATTEDMLAAVIAHEVAHIQLRHGVKIISDMSLYNSLSDAADRANEIASRNNPAARALVLRDSITPIMGAMVKSGYSKPQEFEADKTAAGLLAASGYNPKALTDLLQIFQRTASYTRGGFSDTHPTPAERIANVQTTISGYRVTDTSSYRALRFRNK